MVAHEAVQYWRLVECDFLKAREEFLSSSTMHAKNPHSTLLSSPNKCIFKVCLVFAQKGSKGVCALKLAKCYFPLCNALPPESPENIIATEQLTMSVYVPPLRLVCNFRCGYIIALCYSKPRVICTERCTSSYIT